MEAILYVNGKLVPRDRAHVSALDRGFTLGDGLFETMRVCGGRVFRLAEHLARLRRGAAVLALPLPFSDEEMAQAVVSTLQCNGLEDAIIRLTVSRGISLARGLLPPEEATPSIVIYAVPFVSYPEEKYERGFAAIVASLRRNDTSPTSRIKSCNYLDSVLARKQAACLGADEAILLNTKGELACGTSSNLFLATSSGHLVTPAVECGVLAGITRQVVLEIATGLGLTAEERRISLDELWGCEEAFFTNSVMGVMPLTCLGGHPIGSGKPGGITRALASAYQSVLDGAP